MLNLLQEVICFTTENIKHLKTPDRQTSIKDEEHSSNTSGTKLGLQTIIIAKLLITNITSL